MKLLTILLLTLTIVGSSAHEDLDSAAQDEFTIEEDFNVNSVLHMGDQDWSGEHLKFVKQQLREADFEKLLTDPGVVDTFDTLASNGKISDECKGAMDQFVTDLVNFSMPAWKALDSFGKLPAGVMEGNMLWLGDYNECVNRVVDYTKVRQGRYCFGAFAISPNITLDLTLGTCFPESCTQDEAKAIVSGLIRLKMTDFRCAGPREYTALDIVMIVICSTLALLVVIGTTYDVICTYALPSESPQPTGPPAICTGNTHSIQDGGYVNVGYTSHNETGKHGTLPSLYIQAEETKKKPSTCNSVLQCLGSYYLCFSAFTNGGKILNTAVSDRNLAALNGLRVMSLTWVILGHLQTTVTVASANPVYIIRKVSHFTYQAVVQAHPCVDTFFFLSGLLVCYLTIKQLKKDDGWGPGKWAMYYFHRFWRLTPPYMFSLAFYISLLLHMPEGPLMRALDNSRTMTNCHKNWWTNLLYINNFYPDNPDAGPLPTMCLGWSWYLANDMQFYIISPILVFLLFRYRWAGLAVCGALITMNISVSGAIASHYGLSETRTGSDYGPIEGSGQQNGYIYIHPYHRISPYIIGVLTGYLLYRTKCRIHFSKITVIVGWCLAAACNLSVVYGLYDYNHNYKPMPRHLAALYVAMFRTAWATGVAWVVIACATGYGGPVNRFLSWGLWGPLARLSYVAYLIHVPVIVYYILCLKQPVYLTDLQMAMFFIGFTVAVYAISFVVSLGVEAPTMRLEKLMFGGCRGPTPSKKSASKPADSPVESNQPPGEKDTRL